MRSVLRRSAVVLAASIVTLGIGHGLALADDFSDDPLDSVSNGDLLGDDTENPLKDILGDSDSNNDGSSTDDEGLLGSVGDLLG